MCAELSDADLNAIRKARGFNASDPPRVHLLPVFTLRLSAWLKIWLP